MGPAPPQAVAAVRRAARVPPPGEVLALGAAAFCRTAERSGPAVRNRATVAVGCRARSAAPAAGTVRAAPARDPAAPPAATEQRPGSRIGIHLRWDHRELVRRQDVSPVGDRLADRDRRTAPRIAADRHVTPRVAAELDGGCPLARELLARIVARAPHHAGIAVRNLAVQVGGQFAQGRVCWRPDHWWRDEAHRAPGRILEVDLEVQLAAFVHRHTTGDRVEGGNSSRGKSPVPAPATCCRSLRCDRSWPGWRPARGMSGGYR